MRAPRVLAVLALAGLLLGGWRLYGLCAQRPTIGPSPQVALDVALVPPGPGGPTQQWLDRISPSLRQAGATDADLQALSKHVAWHRAQITTPVSSALARLRQAVVPGASEERAREAVNRFEAEVNAFIGDCGRGEKDLSAKLNLAGRPKLHAALLLAGVTGKGATLMGFTQN